MSSCHIWLYMSLWLMTETYEILFEAWRWQPHIELHPWSLHAFTCNNLYIFNDGFIATLLDIFHNQTLVDMFSACARINLGIAHEQGQFLCKHNLLRALRRKYVTYTVSLIKSISATAPHTVWSVLMEGMYFSICLFNKYFSILGTKQRNE